MIIGRKGTKISRTSKKCQHIFMLDERGLSFSFANVWHRVCYALSAYHFDNKLLTIGTQHHLPFSSLWHPAIMAELTLRLTGGERVLGGGQQVDCLEPVHKGQLAVVRYRVCRQCGLMPAFRATPALVMVVPIVLVATTHLANNARLLTLSLEIRLAGGPRRENAG